MTNGFTRQEAIDLTGIDSGRLSYLDRTKLVVPLKFGNPKHPKVVYSWQQVLEIKTIERLRENLTLQEIRKVLVFLKEHDYEPSFFAHKLVLVNSQLYLVEDLRHFGLTVLEASGVNTVTLLLNYSGRLRSIMYLILRNVQGLH